MGSCPLHEELSTDTRAHPEWPTSRKGPRSLLHSFAQTAWGAWTTRGLWILTSSGVSIHLSPYHGSDETRSISNCRMTMSGLCGKNRRSKNESCLRDSWYNYLYTSV